MIAGNNLSIDNKNDIRIFFNCICKKSSPKLHSVALVETMPKLRDELMGTFKKLSRLELHEFTITFDLDKLGYAIDCNNLNDILEDKVAMFLLEWRKKLNNRKYAEDWCIFVQPEYTKVGVLHYHGIAYHDNANDYWNALLKRKLNGKFGRCTGKKIYDITNYITYISKDYKKHNIHKPMVVSNEAWGSGSTKIAD